VLRGISPPLRLLLPINNKLEAGQEIASQKKIQSPEKPLTQRTSIEILLSTPSS